MDCIGGGVVGLCECGVMWVWVWAYGCIGVVFLVGWMGRGFWRVGDGMVERCLWGRRVWGKKVI